MLETLKAIGEAAKKVVLYILTPFIVVAIIIYYLVKKKDDLEDQLKAKEGTDKLKELQGEQKQIDSNANDAVSEYEKLRGAYVRSNPGSVQSGGGSTEGTDPDKGSGTKPS